MKNDAEKVGESLKETSTEKGLRGKRKNAYVYGAMRRRGWKPKRERKK